MQQESKDYLEVVYDKAAKPLTEYPYRFAGHLVRRYGLKPGMRLLDVGCGRGEMLAAFSSHGIDCAGLDLAPSAGSLAPQVPVTLCNATVEPFPVEDTGFDVVFLKSVIEHMVDPAHLLAEIMRVLKPGGRLIVLTPDWGSVLHVFFEDATHVHPYMPKGIREALHMHGYAGAESELLCHHEAIWGGRPAARFLADLFWSLLTVPQARRLAAATGMPFIRWAVERQILATATKPA